MKKLKLIKVKNESRMIIDLQYIVMEFINLWKELVDWVGSGFRYNNVEFTAKGLEVMKLKFKSFILLISTKEYERGLKDNIESHEAGFEAGQVYEQIRVVEILKSKLEDMPSDADDSMYPLMVESRNQLINEALLAINVQDNGKS